MRRLLLAVLVMGVVFCPASARAQTPIVLSDLHVQLWPEYDQPSMLVIYDFQLGAGATLPVGVSIKFPKSANLVAVAVQSADGSLLNADYREAAADSTWQSVVVQIQSPSIYRIEYYQPLDRSGDRRQFSYEWAADYEVQNLGVTVRMPGDATAIRADPELQSTQAADGTTLLEKDFGPVRQGERFTLRLDYRRASEKLSASEQELQPSQPLSGSTPGRVMLGNYLPYLLGALGLVLVAGGALYFWQSSRGTASRGPRHRGSARKSVLHDTDVYCSQCGSRAELGDRFCRVCGTRLRQST